MVGVTVVKRVLWGCLLDTGADPGFLKRGFICIKVGGSLC